MQRKGLGKHNLKFILSHLKVVLISGLPDVASALSPQTRNPYLTTQLFSTSRIKAWGSRIKLVPCCDYLSPSHPQIYPQPFIFDS